MKCSVIYYIAILLFLSAMIGVIVMGVLLFKQQGQTNSTLLNNNNNNSEPATPSTPSLVDDTPTTSPVMETTPPSGSQFPSQQPSCSGQYQQVRNFAIDPSGSTHFGLSEDGNVICVTNHDYQTSKSYLETFVRQNVVNGVAVVEKSQEEASEGFRIQDLKLSGNGRFLVLGVHNYYYNDAATTGAMIRFERTSTTEWTIQNVISVLEGTDISAVTNVAVSRDGSTLAMVANVNSTHTYVQVYRETFSSGSNDLVQVGSTITSNSLMSFDSNTRVELSGNGMRLFVATLKDNQVYAFGQVGEGDDWTILGTPMNYQVTTPNIHVSYNGTVVALLAYDWPVVIYEEVSTDGDDATSMDWRALGPLDITTNSVGKSKLALSGDGRSVVLAEETDSGIIARLYRKSGSIFSIIQDMTLPDGLFRDIQLDESGEQLVVAVEDRIVAYRKDCQNS